MQLPPMLVNLLIFVHVHEILINPFQTSFQVGGTTLQIKDGQVLATGGNAVADINLKHVSYYSG